MNEKLAAGESEAPAQPRGKNRDRRYAVMGDVAALAGVSQMTVSRVINERAGVRAETRARVLAAMQELHYRPNAAARVLVTGRSKTLGVVSFDTTLYGPASTLYHLELAARAADYFVSVAPMRTLDSQSVNEAVEYLRRQAVDGIVLIAPQRATVEALRKLAIDLPVVVVEGGAGGGSPVAAVDQYAGGTRVTQHLLSLGHETVWHISGPEDWLEAQGRRRAWQDTLVAADREVPPPLVGDWGARSGYEHGRALAAARATAIFVGNDQMALGVLRALREADLQVPDDVSVVGFDDVPEAAYFSPPLTTVRQDFGELGRVSLDLLIRQVEGEQLDSHYAMIEPDLVLRESSGPPPTHLGSARNRG
ncbi:LacI family DNA-binding transcriptional regulator [Egibacter rhizosphaerae]|uniref:LacI family DNA-binding transcriptional regulator n=1 Tax=Egibacter rhizosphaerae TaxID=1670831 RepID=A0A411YAW8_9ACTN|nr:LacI family DNA-binding transcriptional regulator [Egibacter rhizosphaerae]QBI18351.1 LacI family DNA-binding transcriptional regulator [Egibacter rhizosphaerae]